MSEEEHKIMKNQESILQNPKQDALQDQERLRCFDLQYHQRINRIEVNRRKCIIQKLLCCDDQAISQQPQNVVIQPKLFRNSQDLTIVFETQLHLPCSQIEVVIDEIRIILKDSKELQQMNTCQNKYEKGKYINLISMNPNQFLWKIESFVIDVKLISKSIKNMVSHRYQDEQLLHSKTTFISNQQRESLMIKNSIKQQKNTYITNLSLIFYEIEGFQYQIFKSLLTKRKNELKIENIEKESGRNQQKYSINSSTSNSASQVSLVQADVIDIHEIEQLPHDDGCQEMHPKCSDILLSDLINSTTDQQDQHQQNQHPDQIEDIGDILKESNLIKTQINSSQQNHQHCIKFNDISLLQHNHMLIEKQSSNEKNEKNEIEKKAIIYQSFTESDSNHQNIIIGEQITDKENTGIKQQGQFNVVSKKNVVKNIVKAFQRYLRSYQWKAEIQEILLKKKEEEHELFVRKYLSFEKKKSYNNNLIKLLLQNEEYSDIFKYFLINRAKGMVQASNVFDKNSHFLILEKYIAAIQNPYDLDDIISTRKSNSKRKRRAKELMV